MVRTYIDELKDGIRFSSGGSVSISLETAKRLMALYEASNREVTRFGSENRVFTTAIDALDEEMPEPKP